VSFPPPVHDAKFRVLALISRRSFFDVSRLDYGIDTRQIFRDPRAHCPLKVSSGRTGPVPDSSPSRPGRRRTTRVEISRTMPGRMPLFPSLFPGFLARLRGKMMSSVSPHFPILLQILVYLLARDLSSEAFPWLW